MRLIYIYIFLCIPFFLSAAEKSEKNDRNIYSGGMHILQPSYLMFQNSHGSFSTVGSGIGGILRFYIGSNLSAGIYGGSQRASYDTEKSEASYINLGHGGLFLGLTHKAGRWRYNASMGVGRGGINNLHVESQNENELSEAFLYDFGTAVYVPFVGVDYELTKRLLLTLQTSYFFADKMNYQNPVLQIGLLFNR
ncbi:MAG: hypothetical protein ACOCWC_01675 [Bacteroidota bacterium]